MPFFTEQNGMENGNTFLVIPIPWIAECKLAIYFFILQMRKVVLPFHPHPSEGE
jgi:hypothetical protein